MAGSARKRTQNVTASQPKSLVQSLLWLAPVVALFFFLGIFIGSRFTAAHASEPLFPPGGSLPGTRNILPAVAGGASEYRALRGDAMVGRNSFMSEALANKTTTAESIPRSTTPLVTTVQKKDETKSLSESLYASRISYMVGPTDLDSKNILIGAWIYLEDDDVADKSMRTIFTNKKAGCEPKPSQYGLALYVNAWQTSNRRLSLEFGGSSSGCNKLDSGDVQLQSRRWYHVAVALMDHTASLFIDGSVVQSSESLEPHNIQSDNPLFVGQYTGGEYALSGNVSRLAIMHPSRAILDQKALTEAVASIMDLSSTASPPSQTRRNLYAFFPLDDTAQEVDNSRAKEYIRGDHGVYHFPLFKGARIPGIGIPLVDGIAGREATKEMKDKSDEEGRSRRETIKASMSFVWKSYRKYAWGSDELKPLSRTGQDNWGGMGVTLVDSLDTLWIMGLRKEFDEAKEWVAKELTFRRAGSVSVFETTIRELGGLLSAYDLSKEKVFLDKAVELGHLLSPAFRSPTGIAHGMVNLQTGQPALGWAGSAAILSELGTLQLEFRNLAMYSQTPDFEMQSMRALQLMHKRNPKYGLFPIKVDIDNGQWADSHVTFGALGDSFYEYLLKVWIQGGKQETWLREMYDKAMDGVMTVLLKASDVSGLAFLSDWTGSSNIRKMDHLVCFMPGALALGAYNDPDGLSSPRAQRDLAVAKALMYTCHEMYRRQKSGISPEYVEFPGGQLDMIVGPSAPFYILRPETAESLFILNQLTGDPIYRDWAWDIFTAIEKHCKTTEGYGALRNVNIPAEGVDDRMESFFLAETLKYLYLAQDPDKPIDLTKYVFNTEAHPTSIFSSEQHKPVPP